MDGENRMKKRTIFLVLAILIILPVAYGFGVTTPYWNENPLVMSPGQTVEFTLLLQNMVGEEDITALAEVSSGAQFVEITDPIKEYSVPLNTRDKEIHLKVDIPQEAINGDYILGITVTTLPTGGAGMVQFKTAIEQKIPLKIINGAPQPEPIDLTPPVKQEEPAVQEKPKSSGTLLVSLLVLIAIAVIIAILATRKKKKEDPGIGE